MAGTGATGPDDDTAIMDDTAHHDRAGAGGGASPIRTYLETLHATLLPDTRGAVADYIPELSKACPDDLGITIATVDGKLYSVGAAQTPFSIQSMSKPFTYGYALREHGPERVLQQVGVEPTGEAFNAIVLDDVNNRPFNPMVNAGAIAITELIEGPTEAARIQTMLKLFSDMAGRPLEIDEAVYASELETGHRNRAIAYMMLNSGMIRSAPEDVLTLYFKQCAVLVTCEDMAMMAATLAAGGRNPLTGAQVFDPDHVRDILTLMSTCGMYNYAGQWAFEVGIPAKSGVAGGIFAVIPGQAGIAVYSPPLDPHGNSIRGVEACKALSREFSLHSFADHTRVATTIRREVRGSEVTSKRLRSGAERELLARTGDRIVMLEVQGALYFGSTELLIRRMAEVTADCADLIVDFKRVSFADAPAKRLIEQAVRGFPHGEKTLTFAGIAPGGPLDDLQARLKDAGLHVADDHDTALEHCEARLLDRFVETADTTQFSLGKLDLFAGLGRAELAALERVVVPFHYEPDDIVVRQGDRAVMFYVVASGAVRVSIAIADGSHRRLASIGPGQGFGEIALVEDATRTADVYAEERTVCYGFPVEAVRDLGRDHRDLLATILGNMVRNLTARLGQANEEIRALL
jgi:glutaminase